MHPYHNSTILMQIKELEIKLKQERITFEKQTLAPIRKQISILKARRIKELNNYDKKHYS